MGEFVAVAMKEDIAKYGLLPRVAFEKIDIDDVALRDAMLSAACFNNCVSHTRNALGEKPRKFTQMRRFDKGKPHWPRNRRVIPSRADGEGPHTCKPRYREASHVT
jgi:hypothetical protein